MSRPASLLCLLAVAQLACRPSSTAVRYRLPLAGNAGASACYATCHDVRATRGDDAFLDCFAACPGAELTPGARCDHSSDRDRQPVAVCVTGRSTKTGAGGHAATAIIVVVSILLLVTGFVLTAEAGPSS
ncbi:MAG TPA: hypothetical protein VM261_24295 [Kofleriaceae bacterium]|nr:hypothetical protein [Kofleriaceae bacterium]